MLPPGSCQRLDLFIKVLRILCPNLHDVISGENKNSMKKSIDCPSKPVIPKTVPPAVRLMNLSLKNHSWEPVARCENKKANHSTGANLYIL